jgi:alpha-glucosidase
MKRNAALTAVVLLAGIAQITQSDVLRSPDGNILVTCEAKQIDGSQGCLVYRIAYGGKAVLAESRLGLELEGAPLADGLTIVGRNVSQHDSTWTPVYGERSTVRDRYCQLTLHLRETKAPQRLFDLVLRVYNGAVAFCYVLPRQPAMDRIHILGERSEFRFLGDHAAWAVYSAQGKYAKTPLSKVRPGCERPLTIQLEDNLFAALAEARLVDYARMKFAPLDGVPYALVSSLSSDVRADLPLRTPWRVVMVARSCGELLENNDVFLNLNDPCAIQSPSWIKPGKVIREVTLTTAGGKACVDFAARHNLQYVEFDAGWYGHEYSEEADATTVSVDPKRSPGPLDLQDVIRYAESRGVGILLYVNRRALERQLDEILPLYRRWGVRGVKYGFVDVGSQRATAWLHHAVRGAAQNRLMVDVHDEYRPTGYSRTYPNLMTQEGIAGDETSPANELTLTILFTRMLAGAADNTICYYDTRVDRNASHAYQLAKAVCLFSPWQFLYWYDRPQASPAAKGGAGGQKRTIGDEPELEFFDHLPTVWDDTRVLHGRIGRYAVIARRRGADWFVGCMNAIEPRTLEVPLNFLDADQDYVAHVYSDDVKVPTRTHVKIERYLVDGQTVLRVALSAKGGQAIRLVPAANAADYPRYRVPSPTSQCRASQDIPNTP